MLSWDAAFRILINFAVVWLQFLSMKLATVNPLDFSNLPTLLQKDVSSKLPLPNRCCDGPPNE
jgi:hypothetical protein